MSRGQRESVLENAEDERIPTYMASAVWVTILCFPFTGFWAIVESSRVITRLEAGDREGARAASRSARKWILISVVLGLTMVALTVVVGGILVYYLTTIAIS